MAESPRTAQNIDCIMRDVDDIRDYLKALVERESEAEIKNARREMLTAIHRLTSAIESLNSTGHSMQGIYK